MKNLAMFVGLWLFCIGVVFAVGLIIVDYNFAALSVNYYLSILIAGSILTAMVYLSIFLVHFFEWFDEQDGLLKFKPLPTADDLSFKYEI